MLKHINSCRLCYHIKEYNSRNKIWLYQSLGVITFDNLTDAYADLPPIRHITATFLSLESCNAPLFTSFERASIGTLMAQGTCPVINSLFSRTSIITSNESFIILNSGADISLNPTTNEDDGNLYLRYLQPTYQDTQCF